MRTTLAGEGRPWAEIADEMSGMRGHDLDWRHGRHGAYVWYAADELERVLSGAYTMFMVENGLGLRVFPSIERMEREVLECVQGLLHAPEDAAGIFTSGGTESIFLAVYAAREWARATKPGVVVPEIVAPYSAHPAVSKAAHLLGMRVTRVPVAHDFRADVAAMEAAIGPETVMLYASAPTYSLGLVDPVPAVGELAERHGLWLHVDACVGGILAPAVRQIGYEVDSFDFANAGVSSISADLHKSGYAAKPASTLTFRSGALREFAHYQMNEWPSGGYSTYTFTGSRPGGAIAAAWAAFQYLGESGYREIAASSMRAKEAIAKGVEAMGATVFGSPQLWAFAFGFEGLSMGKVAGAMWKRGWLCARTTHPDGIHVMCTPVHEPAADAYLAALGESIAEARAAGGGEAGPARYS